MENDIHERVVKVEERCKSNTHRIDDLEKDRKELNAALNRMASAVEVLATQQKIQSDESKKMGNKVDAIDLKVTDLELAPAKAAKRIRDDVIKQIISIVVGAIAGAILALIIQ